MSESPTEHFEHAEHAEHVAHSGDPFLAKVSITIAVLAVLSAAVGSLETIETAQTISAKTGAAIKQNQATDLWGQFSRESLKKTMYDIAMDGSPADKLEGLKAKSNDYETRSRERRRRRRSWKRSFTRRTRPRSGTNTAIRSSRHRRRCCISRSPSRPSPS